MKFCSLMSGAEYKLSMSQHENIVLYRVTCHFKDSEKLFVAVLRVDIPVCLFRLPCFKLFKLIGATESINLRLF